MRDHGRISKYEHDVSGLSARMDGIQGAILSVKLKYLSEWVRKRRNIAKVYDKLLPPGIKKPVETGGNQHAYHLYVIETENRDSLLKFLNDNGIGAGIHYPVPLHKQKVYKNTSSGRVYLPVTEKSAKNILSLPIFPEMTLGEVKKVSSFVRQFLARRS